jgi:hypothetical protein
MRRQKLTRLLLSLIIVLFTLVVVQVVFAQNSRYLRDGLSFTYPSDWPLTDESDATAQSLNLDRGKDEAKIIIVALRIQMNAQQLAETQPKMTEAIATGLTQEIAKLGAQTERISISENIGGTTASGIRLRAALKGETGDADIYWLALGGRLIHVIFVGSDGERARAAYAWNMVRATLRVGSSPVTPPAQSAAPDLSGYTYTQITGKNVDLYMDQWGRGYVHDLNNRAWVRIPDYSGRQSHHAAEGAAIQIHPSFCKTSNTMALMYAFGGLLVYDSTMYNAQNPNQAWRLNYEVSQRGQAFASITRSRVINHIAQVNDSLALAVGTNWISVYDLSLHKWVNYQGAVDDSSAQLDQNIVLSGSTARVQVLNGPPCSYAAGTGSWRCSAIVRLVDSSL